MSPLHVAAAAVYRNGQILLSRRPDHLHQGGKWEFPGGKVESDESVEQALSRELREELGISPTEFRPLIRVHHQYPDLSVLLDVWHVHAFEGEPTGLEGQVVDWFDPSALASLEFPEANLPIVKAAVLPAILNEAQQSAFKQSEDYLLWESAGEVDWQSFRQFTEQALLPVYLCSTNESVTLDDVWRHGGQGLALDGHS